MLHPTVFNTSHICYQHGVRHVVHSPGSRNAPLTISFARHAHIQKWIIPDERSAAFIALGIAQQIEQPVALHCTSGTALLNYGPAVAEAYYRQIPLLVISADRPPELIDQRDGQTIRQYEALKNHVKGSYQLPIVSDEKSAKSYESILIAGINQALEAPCGPVHINIPFSEPFYPDPSQQLKFKPLSVQEMNADRPKPIHPAIPSDEKKILLLIGQQPIDDRLNQKLEHLSKLIPVIRSPLNNLTMGLDHVDGFINDQQELIPDLLITSGLSVLSKNLKQFLRTHKPRRHLHFDPAGVQVDTYQTRPVLVRDSLLHYLDHLLGVKADAAYLEAWEHFSAKAKEAIGEIIPALPYSEAKAAYQVFASMPGNSILHLSNSMPVRYADLYGVTGTVATWGNRGTSGIDGCTSTALGTALVSKNLNVLVTGDVSFLYDRNAFFHNHTTSNFRIIILNNQGGGIFRLINGPSSLPELEEYFETRHNRSAEYICSESNLSYEKVESEDSLVKALNTFYNPSTTPKVLEVFTSPELNETSYKLLRKRINERIKNSMGKSR